ncbi:hypothetical protein HK097_010594 [Rhizophlyctis rosea]|uniref:Uncharacterized protein n=1 Tax=Rhizophlyctis rosea TaxID=64517 RepID=A0AAD5XA96_9FUNG|nr:hypothetical protein HK097_010594 [Rhizophlyctis rosea]
MLGNAAPWRRVVHNYLVDTLTNSSLFQRFAITTSQKLNELGNAGAQKAKQLQNPEAVEQTQEKVITFFEEFGKELKDGIDKATFRKR